MASFCCLRYVYILEEEGVSLNRANSRCKRNFDDIFCYVHLAQLFYSVALTHYVTSYSVISWHATVLVEDMYDRWQWMLTAFCSWEVPMTRPVMPLRSFPIKSYLRLVAPPILWTKLSVTFKVHSIHVQQKCNFSAVLKGCMRVNEWHGYLSKSQLETKSVKFYVEISTALY
jgi:hypothetical protein